MKRIIDLVKTINRPGVDAVVDYIENSNMATARCHGHHKNKGGLVEHVLEVYEIMKRACSDYIPEESIIICALFHDLGKARRSGWSFNRMEHPARSIAILERCGFEFNEMEAFAIRNHHSKSRSAITHPYRRALSKADGQSTWNWKEKNNALKPRDYLIKAFIDAL